MIVFAVTAVAAAAAAVEIVRFRDWDLNGRCRKKGTHQPNQTNVVYKRVENASEFHACSHFIEPTHNRFRNIEREACHINIR